MISSTKNVIKEIPNPKPSRRNTPSKSNNLIDSFRLGEKPRAWHWVNGGKYLFSHKSGMPASKSFAMKLEKEINIHYNYNNLDLI